MDKAVGIWNTTAKTRRVHGRKLRAAAIQRGGRGGGGVLSQPSTSAEPSSQGCESRGRSASRGGSPEVAARQKAPE